MTDHCKRLIAAAGCPAGSVLAGTAAAPLEALPYASQPTASVQVMYRGFSQAEMKAIGDAQRKNEYNILRQHPDLWQLAQQGVVTVKVIRVSGLHPPSWFRGSHKHM